MNEDRLILGIDPGYGRAGYAIVATQGSALHLVACDTIITPMSRAYPERLQQLYKEIREVVTRYCPREAAIEKLFFGKNAPTAIAVAQARGVCLLALVQSGISIAEYTPNEVKLTVTGYGAATKGQVGDMVRILLHLSSIPRPDDSADAAAIAICHAHTLRLPTMHTPK